MNNIIPQVETLEQNQIGCRKEYQTFDDIFTLRAIIENYFRNSKGSSIKDARTFLQAFNPLPSFCPRLSAFCLATPLVSVNMQNYGKLKKSLKKRRTLYLFLASLFVFQSLAQEDNDNMNSKGPLLSYRNDTEKNIYLQLNPLPSPVQLSPNCCQPPPSPRCGHPLWMTPEGTLYVYFVEF